MLFSILQIHIILIITDNIIIIVTIIILVTISVLVVEICILPFKSLQYIFYFYLIIIYFINAITVKVSSVYYRNIIIIKKLRK